MARTDLLAKYNAKRDFALTAEPKGILGKGKTNRFIVQKHDATRLHYDFRLELGGVLKSWAVTRGPSLDPEDKRLAVRTEDHPMSYAEFEGTIPKGQYGGGTVMLWDVGTWESLPGKDPSKTIEEGHLHFFLHGHRMKGEWLLIRLKPRPGDRGENWLLRKIKDEHAGASGGLVDTHLTSVKTGRSMIDIASGKGGARCGNRTGRRKVAPLLQFPGEGRGPARRRVRAPAFAGEQPLLSSPPSARRSSPPSSIMSRRAPAGCTR